MTFKRSTHGVANYRLFFNSDIIIYTEGRLITETPIEDFGAYDHKYYIALIKAFTPHTKVKLKLVGGKTNALDYHNSILNNSIAGSYVLIDRDYDGLLTTRLPSQKLLTTYGYSWENDFWTDTLCLKTLSSLTIEDEAAEKSFNTKLSRAVSRLKKLGCLSVCAHINGTTIFSSNGHSKGINLLTSKPFPIARSEFSRILKSVHAKGNNYCPCTLTTYSIARTMSKETIIQGHLLEHVVLNLIGHEYKTATREKTCNQVMTKNIAFSHFISDPKSYLTPEANAHYAAEFSKLA